VNDFSYPGLNYLPEDQLQAYYELGELTEKNPEDAVIAIKKKLENCPHPVYEHLMVSAYGYLGMHEEATQLLKQAIEKYSNDFMLRVGYGFILLMNEQYDSLKMFMSGFDLKKVVPDREVFHIMELGRYLCLVCSYYALTNQLFMATVYQKILDDFSDIPEGTYYQKLTTFKILCPLQWEYIQENYRRY
jgi:tetratricopeptide (TPR) repeat protein